jgi:hypothetical protein
MFSDGTMGPINLEFIPWRKVVSATHINPVESLAHRGVRKAALGRELGVRLRKVIAA